MYQRKWPYIHAHPSSGILCWQPPSPLVMQAFQSCMHFELCTPVASLLQSCTLPRRLFFGTFVALFCGHVPLLCFPPHDIPLPPFSHRAPWGHTHEQTSAGSNLRHFDYWNHILPLDYKLGCGVRLVWSETVQGALQHAALSTPWSFDNEAHWKKSWSKIKVFLKSSNPDPLSQEWSGITPFGRIYFILGFIWSLATLMTWF